MERYLPMLAVPAEPFDSPEYLFEVKWNGVRALAVSEPAGWRLWGRAGAEYRERYEIATDPQAYFDESDTALARLSRDVARGVVTAVLENF